MQRLQNRGGVGESRAAPSLRPNSGGLENGLLGTDDLRLDLVNPAAREGRVVLVGMIPDLMTCGPD